jgi:hypothetical protein
MVEYRGQWRIEVIGKNSDWAQRVVVTGSPGRVEIPGVVGAVQVVDGDRWDLTIEHDDGSGWSANDVVQPGLRIVGDLRMLHLVSSKDELRPGDAEPDDLVLRMEKIGPAFELTARPFAADAATVTMLGDGVLTNLQGLQLLGVQVRNTWGEAFPDGFFALDVSALGRAVLSSFGVQIIDAWPPQYLAATGQSLRGSGVRLPAMDVGDEHLLFFLMTTAGARRGKPDVEFSISSALLDPDPTSPQHYSRRQVFIAEVGYDATNGQSFVRGPEGLMTLRLDSIAVDLQALAETCRDVRRSLAASIDPKVATLVRRARTGGLDERACRELAALIADILCRGCGKDCSCDSHCGKDCDSGDGGHGGDVPPGGWPRPCTPGGLWLPLRFEYGVEIDGGFGGQHGPLLFEDPWWKVALLILAVIAWLVGLVASIVADATGWGNVGDLPRKIGTVGASDRTMVDAAVIELDGSRPALQDVADVIAGETNASPIVGLSTVIPIDPQVALPTLTSAAVVGHEVYKSGARTGLTHGIISSLGTFTQCRGEFDEAAGTCTPDPAHPDLVLANQFSIGADPAFGEELFDDHGDSGSIVLSRDPATPHQVVALLHSGNGGSSPIQDVLAALGLRLR